MRKKDEFDLDDNPSFLGSFLVGVIALVIVLVAGVGAYLLLFKEGAGVSAPENVIEESLDTDKDTLTEDNDFETVEEDTEQANAADFGYETEAGANDSEAPERVEEDVEALHNFSEVNETVTAKDATNLRNIPSQGEDSQVMVTLYNGQTATRTGISDSGWSRVIYNSETYYAVSSYLTTDLTPPATQTPEPEPQLEDNGIKTVFTECDEMVSPKMEVNLRTLPSITNPDSVVVVKLPYGSVVRRTGINTDVGWSRVEYEGQVLYCVSSYVFVVE